MISLKECEKLKGDIRDLLIEGEDLDQEDVGCLYEYISTLDNPKGILEHIKEFKEEGNLAYKNEDVVSALEKYGFGGIFLTCLTINGEEDKLRFLDLASSIVLNMAACFLKKKEFMNVGQLCTLVLDYNPSNVKALFRRASAAMELGKNDLAYFDLNLACTIEPANQEVRNLLRKVEHLLHMLEQKKVDLDLDLDSSSTQNSSSDGILKEKENHDKSCKTELEKGMNGEAINSSSNKTAILDQVINGDVTNEVVSIKEDMPMDNVTQTTEEVKIEEVEMKDVGNQREYISGSNKEMHKYQFHNQKRPGSFLTMSKRDYQLLTEGKTIQHFNTRTGTTMSIRVIESPKKTTCMDRENQMKQMNISSSTHLCDQRKRKADNILQDVEHQSLGNKAMEDYQSKPEGAQMDQTVGGAPRVHESVQAINYERAPTCFQSTSSTDRDHNLYCVMSRKNNRAHMNKAMRKRRVKCNNSPCRSSNIMFECRSKVAMKEENKDHPQTSSYILPRFRSGTKRKSDHPQTPDFPQHPRKLLIIKDKNCQFSLSNVCMMHLQNSIVTLAKTSTHG